jgi:hypothetical protein
MTIKSLQNNTSESNDSRDTLRLDGVFRKSSYSSSGGCVSVAKFTDGSVKVQDTKDTTGRTLEYTRKEWLAFLEGVRHGEFDIE